MKTFIRNGPALPSALLRAHEEGRLVFFCGAGVSYYTGLPTFNELVAQAMQRCGFPYDPGRKHHPLDLAFKQGQLDRALHLLEQESRSMRAEVMDILDRPPAPGSEELEIHKALLALARTETGQVQLVTTNFDDRFHKADPSSGPQWQAGPRLSMPRRVLWPGPTYLHGRIDRDNAPDGRELVLTSGDFGRAYLRDGWAARFVVELFREFTVLFVGYSLNDPIVGYLVDALAADTGTDGQFQRAYALADFDGSERDRQCQTDAWRAKGVEPILFRRRRGKDRFGLLNSTLVEWARQYTGGLGSRIDEALKLGAKPSVTVAVTQETRNLAWALSKKDGSVARAFANADSPPDISWLEPLTQIKVPAPAGGPEIGLFDGPSPLPADKGYQLTSLAGRSASHPDLAPVTWELGRWLTRHMDKPELVKWVIERGCQLHPSWKWQLEREFPKLAEPWASFWRLLLDGATESVDFHRWDIRLEVRKGAMPPGLDAALLAAAKPYLKANKPFRWGKAASTLPQRLSDLARFELALVNADLLHDFLNVADQPPFRALLLGLADTLTSRMVDAMRLLQVGGSYIGGMSDRFSLIRQDDLHVREYPALTWLCIRALTVALEDQPAVALSLARRWIDLWRLDRLYLFRRMALHALGLGALDRPDEEVEFLLAECGQVLWAYDCEPELGRYLAQRAPRLPLLVLNRLREAVIAGPTEQSIPGCTADYLAEYSAEKISRRLGKLREGAVTVPLPTEEQPEDMGDVQTVRVVHRGPDNDRADDLLELSPEAVADALLAAEGRFSASRQLADLSTRKPELALACVPLLAEQRDGGWEGWGGLNELARVPNPAPALTTIARVTADHPQLAKGTLLWALAQIMQGWGGQAGSDTAFRTDYLNVWRYLWHAATLEGPDEVRDYDKLDITINHPAGILAEAMVDLIISLPDDEAGSLFGDLDAMAKAGDLAAHHARVIVASRLLWIHRLFPDWTARIIVPCMDRTSPEAVSLWQGYFWGGRWDIPLMEALAPAFLSMRGGFDERQSNGTWNDMLADILMEAPDLLSARDVSRVMRDADEEDLQAMARHFSIRLDAAKEKAGDLWLKAIRPIMDSIWPAATARHTSPVVETLVRMALRCREQFSDAVTLLERRRLLRPLDRDHAILLHLDQDNGELPDYCATAPEEVLLLLSRTIGRDIDPWEAKDLGAVLKRLIEARPDFAERLEFRALEATAAKAG